MKDILYKTLFFSTIAIMLAFMVQTVSPIVHFEPLNGVTFKTEKPKLTLQNHVDGSFQRDAEQFLREHFGFREPLIRLYNQYLWDCFHETGNATVMRGNGNWLFEEICVRDQYESLMYNYTSDTTEMKQILETEALRLWKVQELLKEYNIHIFVDINPGKNMIYPEYLPKNRSFSRPEGIHAYDYLKKRFDELGVNYIDFVPVFKSIKDSVDYRLFPETGTHWSNIASWYAFDSIVRYMEILGNQNLVNLSIGDKQPGGTLSPDNDLEQVLNLAFPIKTPKNMYAYVGSDKDSTAAKPNFLAVGDSYFWNILNYTPIWDIFQSYPYWYYNSTIYGDEKYSSTSEVDLEQELMHSDYIMLIYSPMTLYEFSSNFLPNALLSLCYDKSVIDSMTLDIVETITLYKPEIYSKARQLSEEKNISVEEALYGEAYYLLRLEPEKYFQELKGDKMPISRNKDLKAIRQKYTSTPAQ